MFELPLRDARKVRVQGPPSAAGALSVRQLILFIRRQWPLIAAAVALTVGLGLAYLARTPFTYTATARILVDPSQPKLLSSQSAPEPAGAPDALVVDSEIEVLRSNTLLQRVAEKEGLLSPDRFQPGLLARIGGFFGLGGKDNGEAVRRAILERFRRGVDVYRVGLTYVLSVSYSSTDPALAARITNAIAREYLSLELETEYEKAGRSNEWLRTTLDRVSKEVIEAEQAVTRFKNENGIIGATNGLLSEQALSEINTKLGNARNETAQAKARVDRINDVIATGNADLAVQEALTDPVISKLRTDYADASRRAADLRARYGAEHQATLRQVAEIEQIKRAILQEIRRIAESYKSDYAVALSREAEVNRELETLKSRSEALNEKQDRLRELERQAASSRGLYTTLLARYQETSQTQTLPTPKARIIEQAMVPLYPSWPSRSLVGGLCLVLGVGAGLGLAVLRELLDGRVRSRDDIERLTGQSCLGIIPVLDLNGPSLSVPENSTRTINGRRPLSDKILVPLHRALSRDLGYLDSALRAVHLTTRIHGMRAESRGVIMVLTSTVSGEGKSTLSMLQALYLARTGARTLLVDADMVRPSLSRVLAPEASAGLLGVAAGIAPLQESLWSDPASNLDFLPCSGSKDYLKEDVLANGKLERILEVARDFYDFIIVDLPPVHSLPHARVLSGVIDHFVYISEWGRCEKSAVDDALREAPEVSHKLIGCLLNKADIKRLALYGPYDNYTPYAYAAPQG